MKFLRSLRGLDLLLLILVLASSPLFFVGGPDWLSPPLYRALWNLGHIVFFAVLMCLVHRLWPVKSWIAALGWMMLVFVGGIAIEWLQSKLGRQASWLDVANNLLGAGLGLFWSMAARPWVWLARMSVSLLLLWPLTTVTRVAWVQWDAARQFPLLGSFESQRELLRWSGRVERVAQHATEGYYALKLVFGTDRYSGVALDWFLGDWRGYEYLVFDVFNPDSEPLPVMIRIHDRQHDLGDMAYADRFNRRLTLAPGQSQVKIALAEILRAPDGREMNLQDLRSIGLFTVQLAQEKTLYLDNLHLGF